MFDIIHIHSDFVLINKHPNVSVHKDDGETMLVQEVARVVGDENLFLVHRLDKMTSGLLLLARQQNAARELSQAFAQRKVDKYYLALASKKPKKKQGLICGDMQRSRRSTWKLLNSHSNPAVTQFFSMAADEGVRVFLCKPYTGKTHQIRVALKSIGSAIIGDPIYNGSIDSDRGYLHAFCLAFSYQNQYFRFHCDPNDETLSPVMGALWRSDNVTQVIHQWQQPWSLNWPSLSSTLKSLNS